MSITKLFCSPLIMEIDRQCWGVLSTPPPPPPRSHGRLSPASDQVHQRVLLNDFSSEAAPLYHLTFAAAALPPPPLPTMQSGPCPFKQSHCVHTKAPCCSAAVLA